MASDHAGSVESQLSLAAKRNVVALASKCVLAVLLFFLAAEITARVLIAVGSPASTGSKEMDAKVMCALQAHEGDAIVCLGTSLVSRGVYSELLQARLTRSGMPGQVLNLACGGATPADELLLLHFAMSKGVKPRAVICDWSPILIGVDLLGPMNLSPRLRNSYFWKIRREQPKSIGSFVDVSLTKLSVLYAYRDYLRAKLENSVVSIVDPLKASLLDLTYATQSEVSKSGWAPAYATISKAQLDATYHERAKQIAEYRPLKSGKNPRGYINHKPFADFCKAHNIPLIILWTPVNPDSEPFFRDFIKMTSDDCASVFATTAEPGRVFAVDLHKSDGDTSHFRDFDHLNAGGAVYLTEMLAKILSGAPIRTAISSATGVQGK